MEARDGILSAIHEAQARSGRHWLPPEEFESLLRRFGITKAELRGIASYYSLFSLAPKGRHVIRICVSPVCSMLGSGSLREHLESRLGIEVGGTSADDAFSLEEVQCLGRCAGAPAMMVDGQVHERLDEARIDAILEACRRDAHVPGEGRDA